MNVEVSEDSKLRSSRWASNGRDGKSNTFSKHVRNVLKCVGETEDLLTGTGDKERNGFIAADESFFGKHVSRL